MGKEPRRAIPSPAEQLGGDNEPIDLPPAKSVRCKAIPVDKLAERDRQNFKAGYAAGIEESAKVIDRYSLLKWRSDEIRALLRTEPKP